MEEVLVYLSFIVSIAAVITILARVIRQPPIIAYLISGIIVGPLFFNLIGGQSQTSGLMQIFAHIGVAFLLFIVGLNLDFRLLKEVGKVSVFGGIAQILATTLAGFFITLLLGFSTFVSIFVAVALAFSSTVVAIKILSDKKEIDTLHGRIALGILIIQDFVAALALMVLPLASNQNSIAVIAEKIGMIALVIAAIFACSLFIFNKALDYLARNQEVLFLFGIAWALTIAMLFDYLGFSLEIGALIAGISLASSKYALELGGKMKPLRDFFVVLLFIFFGSQLAGEISSSLLIKAGILSLFVIIIKPVIVMTILAIAGYGKKTNFMTGASLAHISEFSLILVLLGFNLGKLNQEIMSLIVLVSIITIGVSSYGIYYAHGIFNKISRLLVIFEGKKPGAEREKKEEYEIILFGYHRIGYKILQALKKTKVKFVVIDYNPKVILNLTNQGINCIFGDAGDIDFLSQMPIEKAKLIISTIPDEASNLTIKDRLKALKAKTIFMATAEQPRQAIDLYDKGIDYVIIPHHLGGDLISTIVSAFKMEKRKYTELGNNHYKELKKARNNSSFL